MTVLPDYVAFQPCPPTPFKQLFTAASDDAIDLLSNFVKFNPSSRVSAREALQHSYFTFSPPATAPLHLPHPSQTHMPARGSPSLKRTVNTMEERPSSRRRMNEGKQRL